MQNKNTFWIVGGIILLLSIVLIAFFAFRTKSQDSISSFEACAAAGYPVFESFPASCTTPNGDNFVQDISGYPPQNLPPVDDGVPCNMDAKECADGSYVGRTGPSCEFEKCPGE